MYVHDLQIQNYGPVEKLAITLPFSEGQPKPIIFVGPNGSGKSIVLSHIINPLMAAQGQLYRHDPEVEPGMVFKIRSGTFIKNQAELYYSRVQFQDGINHEEIVTRSPKNTYESSLIADLLPEGTNIWNNMDAQLTDNIETNITDNNTSKLTTIFNQNCILYFPHNRFEEPAWLNTDNLRSRAEFLRRPRFRGSTIRRIISYSPLIDNQNWVYDIAVDRFTRDVKTKNLYITDRTTKQTQLVTEHQGFEGQASQFYDAIHRVLGEVLHRTKNPQINFGDRGNRVLYLRSDDGPFAANMFHLSSGETALANIFVSILRDYDLSGAPFQNPADVRGLVVIDEIDLHLHATHQYEILPTLIRMFPKVQFIITTHSPLFVLGMQNLFTDDGFALYRLPTGNQISAEEFSEFGDAYKTLTQTQKYADDLRAKVTATQKTLLFVEGPTDKAYICKAAEHFGKEDFLANFKIELGKGDGNLNNVWKNFKPVMSGLVSQDVVLLYDPEANRHIQNNDEGNLYRRVMPLQESHPIQKGIENLFAKSILDRARNADKSFINVKPGGIEIKNGCDIQFPPIWNVNTPLKSDLCDWNCANGSKEDFAHFREIFDILEEFVDRDAAVTRSIVADSILESNN